MLKISFILPCYKVAAYIGRCLDSLEHQDIPQSEYEIICVDDCSPDNTGEVIREYQQRYPNIIYHRHETNKTAGGARNTGIKLAQGQYLWFVDPDDAIVENVLGRLYETALHRKTDVLLFNLAYTNENGVESICNSYADCKEIISGQEYVLKYCTRKGIYEVASHVSCLYLSDFVINNHIRYPEIRSSQDVVFVWRCVFVAKRVSSIADVCYHVYRRPESTTGSIGKKTATAAISASVLYSIELLTMIDQYEFISDVFVKNLNYEIRLSVNDDSRSILGMNSNELKKMYQEICARKYEIIRLQPYMNRKTNNMFNYHLPYIIWLMMIKMYKIFK